MDKEVEQIIKDIEGSLTSGRDFRRERWALSPDEKAQAPSDARAAIDVESG